MSVSLTKGQKVSLSKEGATLQRIRMALGWDVAKRSGILKSLLGAPSEIDLDASCLVFDQSSELSEVVFYNHLRGQNDAILHMGDNRTGAGEGDDETIAIDLARLPPATKSLVFVVSSYEGHTFDQVANAYCRVVDDVSGKELARLDVSEAGSHTGLIMAKIYLHNGEWKLHAIGEKARAKTPLDFVPVVEAMI